jgi:hypothetical protein
MTQLTHSPGFSFKSFNHEGHGVARRKSNSLVFLAHRPPAPLRYGDCVAVGAREEPEFFGFSFVSLACTALARSAGASVAFFIVNGFFFCVR